MLGRMRTYPRLHYTMALGLLLMPAAARAQFEDGSIVGTIRDSAQAVLLGATVTVTNTATGIVSTRTSSGDGDFEVPALRVGQYDVVVSKPGFTDARAADISVTVGGRQRIDLVLPVGSASTTVDVVSGISL